MKKLLLGMAMVVASQAQAHHHVPAVGWMCKLKASNIRTHSQVELLLVRGETASASGVVTCKDAFGRKVSQNVAIGLTSGGVGPAFNGSLEGLTIYAATVGLASPSAMMGTYNLAAGPRLGLIDARVGVMAGAQVAGHGVGVNLEAVIENRFSVGIDFGSMAMEIRPAAGRVKARY